MLLLCSFKLKCWTCLNVEKPTWASYNALILLCFKILHLNMFVKKKKPIVQCTDVVMQFKNTTYEHVLNVEKAYLGVLRCKNTTYGLLYCCCITHIASHISPAPHLGCVSWTVPHYKPHYSPALYCFLSVPIEGHMNDLKYRQMYRCISIN